MTGPSEAARTRLRSLARDDQGTSLMELLVGMAIMTVFMSIFLTAVLVMFRTANKVQATSVSTSQTTQAFLRVDKTIRYASAVSTPGTSPTSGYWYVEFDVQSNSGTTVDACTQLRVNTGAGQLQQRTWTVTGGTPATASTWLPIASFVTNGSATSGSADVPFTLLTTSAAASSAFERLQLTLVTTASGSDTATNRAQMSFTALNSDVTVAANATTCQQWGRP